MARCIAFDKQTAQAISVKLHWLTICDPGADAVESALQTNSPQSLLVLPSETGGRVLMAHFRRNPSLARSPAPLPPETVNFQAGGFLGLSDEPVFETEAKTPKKWWQRILD
jgi:hypothetical protein